MHAILDFWKDMVEAIAACNSRHHGSKLYSKAEWVEWYRSNELGRADMSFALQEWQSQFTEQGMHDKTKKIIRKCLEEDSRDSKAAAHTKARQAFRAYLKTRVWPSCGGQSAPEIPLSYG